MTAAALAYEMPYMMTVTSDLLGDLTVDPKAIITFHKGLLGFPVCHSFVLLPSEREHVYWLQSADYSSLAFLVVDPFVFFEGFTVDLTATELERSSASPDEIMVLTIVTLPHHAGEHPTANLQGPIIINTSVHEGHQVVLSNSRYSIRETFSL